MVVDAQRLPVERLAEAAAQVAETADLRVALDAIAAAIVDATLADLAVLRILDDGGRLATRAVAPFGSSLGAEAAGTRGLVEAVVAGEATEPTRRVADRARAAGLLAVAARAGGDLVGSIELIRVVREFGDDDRALAAVAAGQLALAVRTSGPEVARARIRGRRLELAGDALAAGGDVRRTARQAVRVAVETTGAGGGALWRLGADRPELVASLGSVEALLGPAATTVVEAVEQRRPAGIAHDLGTTQVATLTLGQPPFAALQLFYAEDVVAPEADLPALAAFAARAAHALRTAERVQELELELARTRSLLEVVAEAISQLSLAHTLETAVERIAELLQVEQVSVFLQDAGGLRAAAGSGRGAADEHVAARLAEALRGPLRARGSLHAGTEGREPQLAAVRAALRAAGRQAVLGVPLTVREESIGLIVAYPGARRLDESETALIAALAAPLAVAVQNARLHEQARAQEVELTAVLESERLVSRRVTALYEISRSFAQTLSLDRTLAAVTETLVKELNVDAAVIRVPDERGDQLVPRAVHVADARLADAIRAILVQPQPRPPRTHEPTMLDAGLAARLGGAHSLLAPFLLGGATAALLPIATASELLAQLTIVSLDPAAPISRETLQTARTIGRQAVLAIDNARLYQQQKKFAETMQRSLLPRDRPSIAGLEVGAVYESAAQVDVGGDVFDFLELPDGRLAVVLGDVTGHGIDATADMAMAKFVFRSLAREHSEPSAFLAAANEVVVGEVAIGKFITMAYVTIEPDGEVVSASAGHPEPRLVSADGSVAGLACGGLALGIEAGQEYEQVSARLSPGGMVVLYTDGVIESRSGHDLFGLERLDHVLSANASLSAQEVADALLAACRDFAGGDLPDDCAIVVLRRT
jgi:serine phosphatase RsbU (regulator of sigma subunit)